MQLDACWGNRSLRPAVPQGVACVCQGEGEGAAHTFDFDLEPWPRQSFNQAHHAELFPTVATKASVNCRCCCCCCNCPAATTHTHIHARTAQCRGSIQWVSDLSSARPIEQHARQMGESREPPALARGLPTGSRKLGKTLGKGKRLHTLLSLFSLSPSPCLSPALHCDA